MKTLNQRKIELFVKDFKMIEQIPKLSKELLQIICSKICRNKYCEFKDFVEILYQISKLITAEETLTKSARLKKLLDEIIFPTFKKESFKIFENNGENIQIFYRVFFCVQSKVNNAAI